MKFEIISYENRFLIKFKAKDLVTTEDKECLRSVCSGLASSFCFEAGSLYCDEFMDYLNSCVKRKPYCVIVGRDENQNPLVRWGILSLAK